MCVNTKISRKGKRKCDGGESDIGVWRGFVYGRYINEGTCVIATSKNWDRQEREDLPIQLLGSRKTLHCVQQTYYGTKKDIDLL